jgi:hypothetical protein
MYFPQTGHNLSVRFKSYWETNGGLLIHGFPLTEELDERSPTDGRMYRVQYFERSKMELHPEFAGTQYEVLLGLLGTITAQQKGYFKGTYPQRGRAADFSWISGELVEHIPNYCTAPRCGCSTVEYSQTRAKAQLEGTWWRQYETRDFIPTNSFIVAFGRLANSDEQGSSCPIARGLSPEQGGTLIYIAAGVQLNSGQNRLPP